MDIKSTISGVVLSGTNDADYIENGGSNVTVYAYNGNDTIETWGGIRNSYIDAGDGNDKIDVANQTRYNTISGGRGDDTIDARRSNSNVYLYAEGDGNDVIYNFNYRSTDTLVITSGAAETVTVGSDVIVKVGDGSILLKGNAAQTISNDTANVTVTGTEYGDFISNTGINSSIVGLTGDDTVYNYANNITISVGDENDVIWNEDDAANALIYAGGGNDSINNWGSYATIYAGDGSDTIYSYSNSATNELIYAGAGDDSVDVDSPYATVYGGTGNDTVGNVDRSRGLRTGFVFGYNYGDGYDTITGIQADSTLIIAGTNYTRTTDGNNAIINVADGAITLVDAANISFTINTLDGANIPVTKFDSIYTYRGGNGVIVNYQLGEQINLASDFTGTRLDGNNFYVNSSSGSLAIENVRDKVISYGDAAGNLLAHSFIASNGGAIDRRGTTAFEVIIGGNYADNEIYAGSGGSSLWGGVGGNDTLIGGGNYDEFVYNTGGGQDIILNAGSEDIVNLNGVVLDQFVGLEVNESAVSATFADGGSLRVEGNSRVGYKLGDVVYTVNQTTNEWSIK